MLLSNPIALITLTSSLPSALSIKRRRFFLHSYSSVLAMAKRNNDGAMSSLQEPLASGGNVDVDANVIPDNPLSNTSPNNESYLMVGTIPVHLDKRTKKNSFYLSTSVFSEPNKVKRRIQVDLGLAEANQNNLGKYSFCSSFDKSPQPSHKMGSSVSVPEFKQYDICFHRKRNSDLIGVTSPEKNKGSWIEMQEEETKQGILRPGMVLLKHFLNHNEQVEIVKGCRDLGLGPGGFYQPGYAGGAKLRLMMMCMGMEWDPQTRKYGYTRVIDGSKPPSIPNCFSELVFRAIQEAHYLINEECRTYHQINEECRISCVEEILPSMNPDICIVNFYTTSGRLGLHQDRDESTESLQKRLPVVSFSIGDSAEFLYGDHRDVEKAENVILESGDVLIFGGESRHVFHGVSSIIPDSAPQELLQDTCLRPGRLNLTFRQY